MMYMGVGMAEVIVMEVITFGGFERLSGVGT